MLHVKYLDEEQIVEWLCQMELDCVTFEDWMLVMFYVFHEIL